VILLNVHFHYRTKDSLLGGMMRPKRAAVENVEPLQITPSFTKKFEDMVAGDRMTCQPEPVVFVKTHKTGGIFKNFNVQIIFKCFFAIRKILFFLQNCGLLKKRLFELVADFGSVGSH